MTLKSLLHLECLFFLVEYPYSNSEILKYANVECADKIDLIVGGPPCQAFSTAGRRMGFQDTRGNVFLKYIDIIINIKPKYFVIENVECVCY